MSTHFCDSGSLAAAFALGARTVLVIGGDYRCEQLARLKAAFPTTKFIWHPTRESDASLEKIERQIAAPDVDVVVILHGLARTAHTKGSRRLCSKHRKPLLWCRRLTVAAIVRAIGSARVADLPLTYQQAG